MLLPRLAALLPLLAVAQAFKNTAPFLMLSNVDLSGLMKPTEVSKHGQIEAALKRAYTKESCKDGRHVLISQPGLTRDDIQAMPKLIAVATSSRMPGRYEVPHVVDAIDDRLVQEQMVEACGPATLVESSSWSWSKPNTKDAKLSVYRGEALPEDASKRSQAVTQLDSTLAEILKHYPSSGTYTIVLVSSPRYTTHNDVQYEMEADYDGGFHQELKRDVHNMKRASNSSSRPKDSLQDGLPLFERYTYFSPALFMGLSVMVLLLLILYVGLTAISGLEVSYKAFDKEMAPQNQKKQQ